MSESTFQDGDGPSNGEAAAEPESNPGSAPDPLDELRREKAALNERLLRTAAEFDNYRKRVDRERRELSEYATSDILSELLPIVDNFERAMQAPAADLDVYRAGVELIHKQMVDLLRRRGVTAFETAGKDFDPMFHQAVVQEPSGAHREGEIIQELQRGYMIGERLLRPAMVKVATPS